MIRPLGRKSVAHVARLVRPYSDMARLGVLLARDSWNERDPEWPARIGHAPAIAVAASLLLGTALWPDAETPVVDTIADNATIVISLVEVAPAALAPTTLQLPALQVPAAPATEPTQPDMVALAEHADAECIDAELVLILTVFVEARRTSTARALRVGRRTFTWDTRGLEHITPLVAVGGQLSLSLLVLSVAGERPRRSSEDLGNSFVVVSPHLMPLAEEDRRSARRTTIGIPSMPLACRSRPSS